MVFYYAVTNYNILNCIIHKLKYNKNKKAVLYISKWHPEHLALVKNIKKTNFFDDVFVFEEVIFPSGNNKVSIRVIKNDIEYVCTKIRENNGIDFDKYSEINVCGDHYGLSVFLNKNNIKYNYFEDGCSILSNFALLMDNIKKFDYSRYQILKYLKLPGNSDCVLARYGDLEAQLEGYSNKKDIHFSVKEELKKIDRVKLRKMISIFDNSFVMENFNDYDILLTFHYNNLGILTLEEQRLFYSYLLDFFGHDKIVIKPHPSDIQGNYKKWFSNIKILPRKLPAEFLPLLVKDNFNSAITGWSTSVNGLKDKVNSIVNFDQQIDYKYKVLVKYFMISQIIVNSLNKEYSIICYNFNVNYIKNFIDYFEKGDSYKYYNCSNIEQITKIVGKKVIIFDKIDNDQIEYVNGVDTNTVIFEVEDICNTILKNDNLIFSIIKKSVIDKKKYVYPCSINYDSFSCVVKSSFLRKKILSLNLEKNLTFANICLNLIFDEDKNNYIINNLKMELDNKNEDLLLYKKESFKQIKKLNETINNKDAEILELKNEINYIVNSNSWKLTSWYRSLGRIIKKVFHKS